MGDFFDKATLNAEEISALSCIDFSKYKRDNRYFICGNHELGRHDASYASCDILSNWGRVIKAACSYSYISDNNPSQIDNIVFLPYIFEDDRQPFATYMPKAGGKRIVFSHNDIKDMQMGSFKSTIGFGIEEIQNNCDLFINGHLHNGDKIADKMFNIGNLTGQNFSEDATKYSHGVYVIDTDEMTIDFYENPHAFNFYKIDASQGLSEPHITSLIKGLKNNAIVTLKCQEKASEGLREVLTPHVEELRIVTQADAEYQTANIEEIQSIDYLSKFISFIQGKIENTSILNEEIGEICK